MSTWIPFNQLTFINKFLKVWIVKFKKSFILDIRTRIAFRFLKEILINYVKQEEEHIEWNVFTSGLKQ